MSSITTNRQAMDLIDDNCYRSLLDNINVGVYCVDEEKKIVYWNKGAEALTGYTAAEVIGTRCSDNLLVHVNSEGCKMCKEFCPIANSMDSGQPMEANCFLHHHDGQRIPVSLRTAPIFDSEGHAIGVAETFIDDSEKIALNSKLEEYRDFALIDPLTGVANRRFIDMNMQTRLGELRRLGWGFGVVSMDIDQFKLINDNYGHTVGDMVLKMVVKTLGNTCRAYDIVGRMGGDEFLAILANADAEKLRTFSDRLRALVENSFITVQNNMLGVTISLGATLATPEDTTESLLRRADELLYRSKAAGRNCVTTD